MDFISKKSFFPIISIPTAIFIYLYFGGKGRHEYKEGFITIQIFAIILLIISFYEFCNILLQKIKQNKNQNTQKNLFKANARKKDLTFDTKFILILALALILISLLTFQKSYEFDSAYSENQLLSITLFITGWLFFISVLQDFRIIVASIFIVSGLFFIHKAISQQNVEFQILSMITIIIGFLLIQNYLLDIDGKKKRTLKDLNTKKKDLI